MKKQHHVVDNSFPWAYLMIRAHVLLVLAYCVMGLMELKTEADVCDLRNAEQDARIAVTQENQQILMNTVHKLQNTVDRQNDTTETLMRRIVELNERVIYRGAR